MNVRFALPAALFLAVAGLASPAVAATPLLTRRAVR